VAPLDVELFSDSLNEMFQFRQVLVRLRAGDTAREVARSGLLAGEAEAAWAAGKPEQAGHLATRIDNELQRLRQSAAPALVGAEPAEINTAVSATDIGELDPQMMADFVALLRQQSWSAVDRFRFLSPQLQRLLSKLSYELVRGDHMENLEFADAARVLEASPP